MKFRIQLICVSEDGAEQQLPHRQKDGASERSAVPSFRDLSRPVTELLGFDSIVRGRSEPRLRTSFGS